MLLRDQVKTFNTQATVLAFDMQPPPQHTACSHTPSPADPDPSSVAEELPIDYGEHAPYIAALRAVFDEDAAAFASVLDSSPHVVESVYRGWPLLHHIAFMEWVQGMDIYMAKNGRVDIKSEDFATAFGGGSMQLQLCQVGGQTLLHVAALSTSKDSFKRMSAKFPEANIPDDNGHLPAYYLSSRDIPKADKDLVMARVAQRSLMDLQQQQRHHVTFDQHELMDGVRCFELPAEVCTSLISDIAQLQQSIPNSMHRYGKILLPDMKGAVHSLVASVLPAGDAQRVNHIHAFYIQYSEQVGQKSLDSHMDDSHWTINLCLSVSDDLRGSELVFDPQLVTCVKRTRAASALCNVFTGTGTAKQGAVSSTAGACATTCSRCSADNARTSSCGLTCCPSSTLPQAAEATMTLEVEGIKHESISLADNHRHMLRHQTRHVPSHASRAITRVPSHASREEGAHALRYHGAAQRTARDFVCKAVPQHVR